MDYESKEAGHKHRFYSYTMRPALLESVTRALEETPLVDQLDCTAELELIRRAASHVVEKYSEVVESQPENLEAKMTAGLLMAEQLQQVIDAAADVGKIEEIKLKAAGSIATMMQQFVSVIVNAASEVFKDDYRVRDFESKIRELLSARPTGIGYDGTVITPDMDVTEMDAMVPNEPADAT